jgi:hypothetical protein
MSRLSSSSSAMTMRMPVSASVKVDAPLLLENSGDGALAKGSHDPTEILGWRAPNVNPVDLRMLPDDQPAIAQTTDEPHSSSDEPHGARFFFEDQRAAAAFFASARR